MLDLDHPMTKHIFAAGAMEDFLLVSAQRMTLVPSPQRLSLLAECLQVLDRMRRLNEEHFQASSFIADALDEGQEALEGIAHQGGGNIVEDRSDGPGACAACGSPIFRFEKYSNSGDYMMLCLRCIEPFMEAKAKLKSRHGFRTSFI